MSDGPADGSIANVSLVYADLDKRGYSRVRKGKGFFYTGTKGRPLKRRSLVEYCQSLVIPPAWRDVWISPAQNAHILSTGVDDAGRKQYIYHPEWSRVRNTKKFSDLPAFAKQLPSLRTKIDSDMRQRKHSKSQVVATALNLIDLGFLRVGNQQYAQKSGTRGATTLHSRHLSISGDEVTLDFIGKSGKQRHIELRNETLAKNLAACQELPGQRLFQYRDEYGKLTRIDSTDVNDYLQACTQRSFTAKHFRTWGGSVLAMQYLFESKKIEASKKRERDMVKHVASQLGNTVSVARQYYIHPSLLELARTESQTTCSRRRRNGLTPSESQLVRFLECL